MCVVRSRCGRWRVEIRDDQTAALWECDALVLTGPLYAIGERLAELGVTGGDLVPG